MLSGIIFFNTELNKPHFLRNKMIFMHCRLHIKQKIYSRGIFRAPVVTQFIVKVYRKIEKSPIFESYQFLYSSTFSKCKGVSRASSDCIIYYNKQYVGTKSLVCQTMIVNKVPNFPSFFTNILLKISASV